MGYEFEESLWNFLQINNKAHRNSWSNQEKLGESSQGLLGIESFLGFQKLFLQFFVTFVIFDVVFY